MPAVVSLLYARVYPDGSFVCASRVRTFFTTATAFEFDDCWMETRTEGFPLTRA